MLLHHFASEIKTLKSIKEKSNKSDLFFAEKRSSSDTPKDNSGSSTKPRGDAMYHTARFCGTFYELP